MTTPDQTYFVDDGHALFHGALIGLLMGQMVDKERILLVKWVVPVIDDAHNYTDTVEVTMESGRVYSVQSRLVPDTTTSRASRRQEQTGAPTP